MNAARGDRLRSRPPAGGSRLQRVAGPPTARVGCSTTPTGTAASRQGGWAACGSAARGSPPARVAASVRRHRRRVAAPAHRQGQPPLLRNEGKG
ncbi:hypothetical protein BHE74_00025278 [Ensete ventricosum]|nr:hypothetical protein BHE74_00025278 [Ensete ventricosum]